MKLKAVLLLLFVLFFLAGCNTQAAPAGTGSSGESAKPTVATTPTWETDPLLSLLPKPEGEYIIQTGDGMESSAHFKTMDLEDAKAYAELIKQAGFTAYSAENESFMVYLGEIEVIEYYFSATNSNGYSARIQLTNGYTDMNTGEWVKQWNCYIDVVGSQESNNITPPAGVVKNQEDWDSNKFRAWLPKPPTQYWRGNRCKTDTLDHYAIYLDYIGMAELMAYVEEIRSAGFNIDEFIEIGTGANRLRFSAYNAQGWSIEITRAPQKNSAYYLTMIRIWEPGGPSDAAWKQQNNIGGYPEPPSEDWECQSIIGNHRILLRGMDYEDASQYMEQLRAACYDFAVFIQKNDPETMEIDFSALVTLTASDGSENDYYVRLIYDPSREDCPCVLYM